MVRPVFLTGGKAALPEQGRLLVARHAGHRHPHTLDIGVAVDLAGVPHLRQEAPGNVQRPQQGVIPVQRPDIVEHGAAGVGPVGDVDFSAGELPHQPGVHRAEQQLPGLGLFPGTGDIVQDPADLGGGEVGVRHKAGVLPDIFLHARDLQQLVHQRGRAAALPDDGIADRAAGGAVPQDRGLPLIGDADARDVPGVHAALGHHLVHHAVLAGPDLHGVMLHPALPGVDLFKLPLPGADHLLPVIKQDRTAAGRALIQCKDIFCSVHAALRNRCSYRDCTPVPLPDATRLPAFVQLA